MEFHFENREKRYSKSENVVCRDIADEIILVPIRGNLADMQRIFALDPVADFIWEQLDGAQSLGNIHASVVKNYDVDADQAAQDLNTFIADLSKANLINEVL